MTASNIHYEIADRTRSLPRAANCRHTPLGPASSDLMEAINECLGLLKIHLRLTTTSDHVLNIAYNLQAGASAQGAPPTRGAATKHTSTPLGLAAFPIPPRRAISVAASTRPDIYCLAQLFNAIRLKVLAAAAEASLRGSGPISTG